MLYPRNMPNCIYGNESNSPPADFPLLLWPGPLHIRQHPAAGVGEAAGEGQRLPGAAAPGGNGEVLHRHRRRVLQAGTANFSRGRTEPLGDPAAGRLRVDSRFLHPQPEVLAFAGRREQGNLDDPEGGGRGLESQAGRVSRRVDIRSRRDPGTPPSA